MIDQATLLLDGQEIPLRHYRLVVGQDSEQTTTAPLRTHIHLTVEAIRQEVLIDWATSGRALKDGQILLEDHMKSLRRVSFRAARCLHYEEQCQEGQGEFAAIIVLAPESVKFATKPTERKAFNR